MTKDQVPQLPQNSKMERLADFFNEIGMLKHTPRSGFAFLRSGSENVAEHSFRTTVIGYVLAGLAEARREKVVALCLFHDLHEARTGDFNYVNHRYDSCNARKALEDATTGTGLENEILDLWNELQKGETLEATLASDADQLDLICNLHEELVRGNHSARDWLDSALPRLQHPISRKLADAILKEDINNWWRRMVEAAWWIDHGGRKS